MKVDLDKELPSYMAQELQMYVDLRNGLVMDSRKHTVSLLHVYPEHTVCARDLHNYVCNEDLLIVCDQRIDTLSGNRRKQTHSRVKRVDLDGNGYYTMEIK